MIANQFGKLIFEKSHLMSVIFLVEDEFVIEVVQGAI